MQHEFSAEVPPLDELLQDGMGQLTRVFGTRPVPPAAGMSPTPVHGTMIQKE